jgi:DNA repair/transcription protein MET18/MMS19
MGTEFLSGYATLVEGEKDPRNLMTAFAIARVILIEFDTADHIEVCFKSQLVMSRWLTLT